MHGHSYAWIIVIGDYLVRYLVGTFNGLLGVVATNRLERSPTGALVARGLNYCSVT